MAEPNSYQPLYACSSEAGPDKPSAPRRHRSEGPEGEVRRPPEHAFEATTYCPKGMHDEDIDKMHKGSEVVTGHDRLRPTRTPATLFRSATILLIVLWLVGLLVPLELLHNFLAKPLIASIFVQTIDPKTGQVSGEKEVHALVGSDRNGLPELIPVMEEKRRIPRMARGVKLHVEWPSHSAFVPRALTCDPAGEWLVVADDFGLYAGRVQASEVDGHGDKDRRERPSVAFQASPRCWALEGQAFNDIGGYCRSESDCGVLVLSEDGSTLTECPFREGEESPATWRLAGDWLRKGENIQALAIRSTCVQQKAPEDPAPALSLQGRAGCVVLGTSVGRIVELESSAEGDPDFIVPEQVLIERPLASTHGSLADVPGGILLALWHTKGVLSAFDQDGALVGEWRLPKHVHWLMVASGGPYIFVLGVAQAGSAEDGSDGGGEEEEEEEIVQSERHEAGGRARGGQRRHKKVSARRVLVELHRFRMPEELLQASQAAQPRLLEL